MNTGNEPSLEKSRMSIRKSKMPFLMKIQNALQENIGSRGKSRMLIRNSRNLRKNLECSNVKFRMSIRNCRNLRKI